MDLVISGLLLFGLFFLLVGTFGMLRFRDVYTRMHATSKSTTFGVVGVLFASLLQSVPFDMSTGLKELLILVFLFLTAPVGAHMIARAAYQARVELWRGGVVDELKEWQEREREENTN